MGLPQTLGLTLTIRAGSILMFAATIPITAHELGGRRRDRGSWIRFPVMIQIDFCAANQVTSCHFFGSAG